MSLLEKSKKSDSIKTGKALSGVALELLFKEKVFFALIVLSTISLTVIYAIFIEEYGLFGGVMALWFYLFLMFRAIRISLRIESVFGSLLSIGLMFSLVFQALINMLVSVEIIPVTGQTLPLISMGGTSIVFSCIAIGIVLSVSRDATDRAYEKA